MKHQPRTWDELLDAGYVVELTEEQVALARVRLNGDQAKPFSYANGDHLSNGPKQEERMRKQHSKGGK